MSTEGTTPMDTVQHSDAVIAVPELEALNLPDRHDGPGAAMMISAGIGIFVLGVLIVLAEVSVPAKTWLQSWEFGQGVGPLAGKTTIAALVYFLSLIILWVIWRKKNINLKIAFYIGLGLGILGAIMNYPTFFQMFTVH